MSNRYQKDVTFVFGSGRKIKIESSENHGKEFPYRFIETDVYGTRSTTSITIDNNNKAIVEETSFIKGKMMNPAKKFEIEIS